MKDRITIAISFWGYLLKALFVLLLPLKWLVASAVAAWVHELFHFLAIVLCGEKVTGLTVHDFGITMETHDLLPWQELICALAGPAGSALLFLLAKNYSVLKLCAFVQGIFNLLPFYPLDGGRALLCAARMLWGINGEKVYYKIEILFLAALLCYFAIRYHSIIFS